MVKKHYHIYDSDFDGPPLKVKSHKAVMDYIRDDFVSDSPVHVETFHDGKSQGTKTYDPKTLPTNSKTSTDKYAFKH